MRVSVIDAEGRLAELVRRAEAGDEIVLTRDGHADVRLVPSVPNHKEKPMVDREARRALLEHISLKAAAKAKPWTTAARSQDYLYDDDGLPGCSSSIRQH